MTNHIEKSWLKKMALVFALSLFFSAVTFNKTEATISSSTLKSVVKIICVTNEGTWSGV